MCISWSFNFFFGSFFTNLILERGLGITFGSFKFYIYIYIYIGIFVFDNYNKENYTIGIIIKSHGAMATLVQTWPHPGHP